MNRGIFLKLINDIEESTLSKATVKVVVLNDYPSFKSIILDTFSSKFDEATIKRAYHGAQSALLRMQSSAAKRDPVSYKIVKAHLTGQPGLYIVTSPVSAMKQVASEVRTYLGSVKPIDSKEKLNKPFISLNTNGAAALLESPYLTEGTIDPSSIKSVQSGLAYYNITAGMSSGIKGRFNFVFNIMGEPRNMESRLTALASSVVNVNELGDKISKDVFNAIKTGSSTAPVKKTGRHIYTNNKKPVVKMKEAQRVIKRNTGSNISVINLINLINRKLPMQIKSNMGSPRLNWRTGRFAHSARVLAISNDHEIKYTYMKRPYAVFEMSELGNPQWATRARDPRNIISLSVREIAATVTDQKFRTRRV